MSHTSLISPTYAGHSFNDILTGYLAANLRVQRDIDKAHNLNVQKYTHAALFLILKRHIHEGNLTDPAKHMLANLIEKGVLESGQDLQMSVHKHIEDSHIIEKEGHFTQKDGNILNLTEAYVRATLGRTDSHTAIRLWVAHKSAMQEVARQKITQHIIHTSIDWPSR